MAPSLNLLKCSSVTVILQLGRSVHFSEICNLVKSLRPEDSYCNRCCLAAVLTSPQRSILTVKFGACPFNSYQAFDYFS